MTFNAQSVSPGHWSEVIYTWAQVENIPEEILGYVCFSNFLASLQEDFGDPSWPLSLQEEYLEACCDGNEALMNIVRWAASTRDFMEGLYAQQTTSWEVFEARDIGMYAVAIEILSENFDKLDVAQHLVEEIRKRVPKRPAPDSSVN